MVKVRGNRSSTAAIVAVENAVPIAAARMVIETFAAGCVPRDRPAITL